MTQIWSVMNKFDSLSAETVSLCSQLLIELYLTLKKKSEALAFGSTTFKINPNFAIFLTIEGSAYKNLPGGIKESFREYKLLVPDLATMVEQWMLLAGFSKDAELASLTARFFQLSASQIPSKRGRVSFFEVKKTISEANEYLSSASSERSAMMSALNGCFLSQLAEAEKHLYRMAIINIFGPTVMPSPSEEAAHVVSDYYRVRSLKASDLVVQSVIDCQEVIGRWKAVHVVYNESPGKNLALECVKHLSGKLHQRHISSKLVFPKAYSLDDLYGTFVAKQGSAVPHYRPGVIQYLMASLASMHPTAVNEETGRMQAVHSEKNIERWMEFDGTVSNDWMEGLATAIEGSDSYIILPNYEKLRVPENMKFLFRSATLAHASPATVTRLGIVHLRSDYSWTDRVAATADRLVAENPILKEKAIMKRVGEAILKFFQFLFDGRVISKSDWLMPMTEHEIVGNYMQVFAQLIAAFLNSGFEKDEHLAKLDAIVSSYSFVALGLAVGALLHDQSLARFEQLVSDKFIHFMARPSDQVMAVAIHPKTGMAELASKTHNSRPVHLQMKGDSGPVSRIRMVPSMAVWQSQALATFLSSKLNIMVLATRDSAVDCTLRLATNDLVMGNTPNMQKVAFKLTADIRGNDLTKRLTTALMAKNSRTFASILPGGALVVVEDLNMPAPDACGEVEVLERLRRLAANGSFVDLDLREEITFEGLQFVLTADYKHASLAPLGKKLRRGMVVLRLAENSEADFKETLFQIVGSGSSVTFSPAATDDVKNTAFESMVAVAWSVASVCKSMLAGTVPASAFLHESIFDSVATFAATKADFEKETDYLNLGINSLVLHLTSAANDQDSIAQITAAVQQATAKSCRFFEWQKFVFTMYPVSFKLDDRSVVPVANPRGREEFAELVKKAVGKKGSELHVIEETLNCLSRCATKLLADGSRVLLNCAAGTDTEGMLRAVAALHQFVYLPIDAGTGNQLESMAQQLGKLMLRIFSEKKTFLVALRLNGIHDGRVLRLLQDIFEIGSVTHLDIDKQKMADALLIADYGQDSHAFIKDITARKCRLVFIEELYGSTGASEDLHWYSLVSSSTKITLMNWKAESFGKVAKAIMSDYEDLDMTAADMETYAGILSSMHQICAESHDITQEAFESFVHYMCDFRVKSKVEIRDQLRNAQAGLGRYKSLIKIHEEMAAKEAELKELANIKQKELNKLTKDIEVAQNATRERKRY